MFGLSIAVEKCIAIIEGKGGVDAFEWDQFKHDLS